MFSIVKKSVPIIIAIPIGYTTLSLAKNTLKNPTGSDGLSILFSHNPFTATLTFLAAILLAIFLASLFSPFSRRITGALTCFLTLTCYAIQGGSIEGFIKRHNANPINDYQTFITESIIWLALIAFIYNAISLLATQIDKLVKSKTKLKPDQYNTTQIESLNIKSAITITLIITAISATLNPLQFIIIPIFLIILAAILVALKKAPDTLLAASICFTIAQPIALILLKNWHIGQAIAALFLSFTVSTLVAQMIFPKAKSQVFIYIPMLLAITHYNYLLTNFDNTTFQIALSETLNQSEVTTPILYPIVFAMPIYFATAAVAGTLLGASWAQSLIIRPSEELVSN